MTTGFDHQLGQKIAALFTAQQASDLPPSAILSQVQDLLGADTSLLGPLRDLLLRPTFRQLISQASGGGSHSLLLAGRDALLQDLALTYHPGVVSRLAAVIDGSLGLPPGSVPAAAAAGVGTPTGANPFQGASGDPRAATGGWAGSTTYASQPPPWAGAPAPPSQQVPYVAPPAPASGPSPVTALLIALVSLLSGAVLLALGWMLFSGRPQVSGGGASVSSTSPSPAPSPSSTPAPAPSATPKGSSASPPAPSSDGAWGNASEYKFGQVPGGSYPNSCAFSVTDANGRTTTDKSHVEYWACRDVGGNPDSGYRVVWADGKETTYTFGADGNGTVVGTNGSSYPMRWRNDSHRGSDIVAIDHQDGAISWIPGHIRSSQD